MSKYVISGHRDSETDEFLYWSNSEGWVNLADATTFDLEKDQIIYLPMGAVFIEAIKERKADV